MLQQIIDLLPDSASHIHAPLFLAVAAFGLLLALVGARISRPVIALSLVSAGTVIGLHLPRWFGWSIDPMGTAFGAAIVLGVSGYMLPAMWEGILLGALLAVAGGAGVWMRLAPHAAWHRPEIDWSSTAVEIAARIRLSLPAALTTVLPVVLGIGATIGALWMVIFQKLGRVFLFAVLGMGTLVIAGALGAKQLRPELLNQIPAEPWTQGAIFSLAVLLSAGMQWLLLPRPKKLAIAAPSSGNQFQLNQFVAKGPALRVGAAESAVLSVGLRKPSAGAGPRKIPTRIQ